MSWPPPEPSMLPMMDVPVPDLEDEVRLPARWWSRWWSRWAPDVTASMWYRAFVTVVIVLVLTLAVVGGLIRISEVIL